MTKLIGRFRRATRAAAMLGTLLAGMAVARAAEDARPDVERSAACPFRVMNVVAHQDDDLVFFGAAEIEDIAAGACVRTVYLTTGDARTAAGPWLDREIGAVFAHETMAGERHKPPRDEVLKLTGRRIAMRTLARNERVSLVFLRLPGGGAEGDDGPQTGPSLAMLWTGAVDSLSTVEDAAQDGLATRQSYSKPSLVATLYKLMAQFQPDRIRIQNFRDAPLDGARGAIDHPDHVAAALFAYEAAKAYSPRLAAPISEVVTGYRGHETSSYVRNLSGPTLATKLAAFADYARFDRSVCADSLDCAAYRRERPNFQGYSRWLGREYPLDAARNAFISAPLRAANGLCLTVRAGAAAADPCAEDEAQRWRYDARSGLVAGSDGSRCLAAEGTSTAIKPCDARDPAARWSLSEDGEVLNAGSGKCLTAPANGRAMTLSSCVYGPRQLFGYDEDPIRPVAHALVGAGDRCLTLDAGPGATASMRTCAGVAASRWSFTPSGTLRNGNGGLCLGADHGTPQSGGAALGQPCVRSEPAQRWQYDPASGEIADQPAGPSRRCLEAPSHEGAAIRAAACDGSHDQTWAIDSD